MNFAFPDITVPNLNDIPTLKDNLKPVIAAVLAGAMLQKAEVQKGQEMQYLLEQYNRFQQVV